MGETDVIDAKKSKKIDVSTNALEINSMVRQVLKNI